MCFCVCRSCFFAAMGQVFLFFVSAFCLFVCLRVCLCVCARVCSCGASILFWFTAPVLHVFFDFPSGMAVLFFVSSSFLLAW